MRRLIGLVLYAVIVPAGMAAQSADPITSASLIYKGSFRVSDAMGSDATPRPQAYPIEGIHADTLSFGGHIAFDAVRRQLVMGTRFSRVVALSIPEPRITDLVADLPVADRLSPFLDASANTWNTTSDDGDWSGKGRYGLLVWGDRLIVTGSTYYDANNNQRRGHIVAQWPPTSPTPTVLTPWRTVGNANQQGLIAGPMLHVPLTHQAALKGNVCTFQAALPIISRGSAGPALWCFTASDLLTKQDVPATFVLGYPGGHWTLGSWDDSGPMYGISTEVTGAAIVDDTVVFLGSNGLGPKCYGNGTGDKALAGTKGSDGELYCYDPTSNSKSQHSYPYRPQMWAYPIADLAAVASGAREPWSLVPTFWNLEWRWQTGPNRTAGMAYDETTRTLYAVALNAGPGTTPIVHVYGVAAVSPSPSPDQVIALLQSERSRLTTELETAKLGLTATQQALDAASTRITEITTDLQTMYVRSIRVKNTPKWLLDALRTALAK